MTELSYSVDRVVDLSIKCEYRDKPVDNMRGRKIYIKDVPQVGCF